MLGRLPGEKREPGEICREVIDALRAELPECRLMAAEGNPFEVEATHPDEDIGSLQLYLGHIVRDVQGARTKRVSVRR